MAIYQFLLIAIPEKGIIEKYGYLPDKLVIDYKERTEHYHSKKEGLLNGKEIYNDALLQKWWNTTHINPMEIIHQIDKIITRTNYSRDTFVSWKYYTPETDNDASLSFDQDTYKIQEFRFRADLREKNLKFLNDMINLSSKYNWTLMDMNGNLAKPNLEEVSKLIKISNSYRFLKNPIKFFDDIESGKIKIE